MARSLFSDNWYRVAGLRPRLRSHARIHRQRFRGQTWYILQDHASGRFHRFSPAANFMVGLMNGQHTVNEIWERAGERLGDDVPSQDEVIHLLAQLHMADVLQSDVPPDIIEISRRSEDTRRRELLMKIRNPMAMRFPLIDPDRFLEATLGLVRPLFSVYGFLAWLALVVYGATQAVLHWAELTQNVGDRVLAAENIVLIILIYPFIKALHELGHGYATKRWGGEVHEMGVMLLVLMPVPYVDASACAAFREKWRRAVVGGAGIMVEMALAALAMVVWLNVEPGLVRAGAFNVMLIAGISTVLFNGNPLLRFDGYYVLVDILEIPNLGTRANKHLQYLIQRYVFGLSDVTSPATAPGERFWFVVYGLGAFCYRLFIIAFIVGFIATKLFAIGVVLAIWACVAMVFVPLGKGLRYLFADPALRRRRKRALTVTGAAAAAMLAVVLALPVPYATIAEGVVWLPERARVQAGTEGVIAEVVAPPDGTVRADQALFRLEDPYLASRVRVLEAQLSELKLRLDAIAFIDRVQADIFRERIRHAEAALALYRERAEKLTVRGAASGRFVVASAEDLVGRFVRKGDLLAYVLGRETPTIRIIVPQERIDLVRQRTTSIAVRTDQHLDAVRHAVIAREVPAVTDRLPSLALATSGGGSVAMDPSAPDSKTLEGLYQLELRMQEPLVDVTVGGRAHVRFGHGYEPLAYRLFRSLRQLLLKHFNV